MEDEAESELYLLEKQKESSKLREELSEYLEYISEKKDSEGKPLVSIPANFNVIANSMNRDDIRSQNEAPWSKYLFQESFDNILKQEFAGRYDQYLSETPDVRISKGLAQIQLFDRQLQELNRKVPDTARSQATEVNDNTFLTKKYANEHQEQASISPRISARDSVHTVHKQPAEIPVAPASLVITPEVNQRYEALMSVDDDKMFTSDDYLNELKEVHAQMNEIDNNLTQYGRVERLVDVDFDADKKEDVLTAQRKERANKEYMNKIDSLLDKAAKPIDLSGLIYESASTKKKDQSNRLDVPQPNNVKIDKLVTMSDIVSLLNGLHSSEYKDMNSDEDNGSNSKSSDGDLPISDITAINNLLKQYHSDVQRLAKMRASQHSITTSTNTVSVVPSSSSGSRSDNLLNDKTRVLLRSLEEQLRRQQQRLEDGDDDYYSDSEEEAEVVVESVNAVKSNVAIDSKSDLNSDISSEDYINQFISLPPPVRVSVAAAKANAAATTMRRNDMNINDEIKELPPFPKPLTSKEKSPKKKHLIHVKHIRVDHSNDQHTHSSNYNNNSSSCRGGEQLIVAPNVFTNVMSVTNSSYEMNNPHQVSRSHQVKNAMRIKKAHNIIGGSSSSNSSAAAGNSSSTSRKLII